MTDMLAFVRALELDGVPADTATSFLEILARAGGRWTRLSLFCIDATAPFVAALAPVAARVVDLEFDELTGDDISELFAGRPRYSLQLDDTCVTPLGLSGSEGVVWFFSNTAMMPVEAVTLALGRPQAPPVLPALVLEAMLERLRGRDAADAVRVSRAWAAATRPRLYAAVEVRGAAATRSNPTRDRSNFLILSDSQLARLGWLGPTTADSTGAAGSLTDALEFVRTLEINGVPSNTAAIFLEALARAGARLTRLSLIRMNTSPRLVAALASVAASVTHLMIDGLKGADISKLFTGRLVVLRPKL
ncbi:hypothetical protein HK405_006894, partial [Cladochytrium tenue]